MSLLHRWSLPSRGFVANKSRDEEPAQSNFSTIHIGPPGPRRRANISSAFSTLFEKSENRRSIRDLQDCHQGDELPLLRQRRENIPPDVPPKYSHAHRGEETGSLEIDIFTSLGQGRKFESDSLKDVEKETSPRLWSAQVKHRVGKLPKIRSSNQCSSSTNKTDKQGDESLVFQTKSTSELVRVRSTSSSYPSEGIRSPHDGNGSPEPTTNTNNNYLAKYWGHGKYPSRSSCRLSSMPVSDGSAGIAREIRHTRATRASSDTIASYTPAGQNATSLISPFLDPPEERNAVRSSGTIRAGNQTHNASSYSEVVVPILENENAMTSQLDVRFMLYNKPSARSTSDDDGGRQPRVSDVGSEDRLCRRTETNETALTAIRHTTLSDRDDDDGWSTIHESGARPLSRHTSWLQLFTMNNSNGSSVTLTQRFQKFKLRKWVRKVCFRTKAGFEVVGRPVKLVGAQVVPRRMWRNKKRKGKKRVMAKKRLGGKMKTLDWDVEKTLDVSKRPRRQHKTLTDRLLGSLVKRKSLQFRFYKSEKKRARAEVAHKRVQSCPAVIGV
ncbi:hypothetical protein GGS21DRAFT_527241 [Xylaria nigripes]|nr:hypothetical protein GGS21DRAFT_527241 [Xylaria nigripes]